MGFRNIAQDLKILVHNQQLVPNFMGLSTLCWFISNSIYAGAPDTIISAFCNRSFSEKPLNNYSKRKKTPELTMFSPTLFFSQE